MTHLETEVKRLKDDLKEMMLLTNNQLRKAREAMFNFDKNLSREIIFYERRINSLELKIDRDCENILALLTPVAIDLRFVLASLKINSSLERTADNADSLARFVIEMQEPFDANLMRKIKLPEMFDIAESMLDDIYEAFDKEDTRIARNVLLKDDRMDEINMVASHTTEEYIKENLDKAYQALFILSGVHKLERVGDQAQNIAEEIIFYIEAKVLKHKPPVF